MPKRPVCRTDGCRRRTPNSGREYCTTCRPAPTDTGIPVPHRLAIALHDQTPAGRVAFEILRDDDPDRFTIIGRCLTCTTVVDHETFDVPDDPQGWAEAHALVLTLTHGHQVTVAWALTSQSAQERGATPRVGAAPRQVVSANG